MDIVDKTRTRIMFKVMEALHMGQRIDLNNDGGVQQWTPDTLQETFVWHDDAGIWDVSTTITINVTKQKRETG